MNPDVDAYIERSAHWRKEMAALRPVLLGAGLVEQIKWGKPCYSREGANIVILQEMKNFLSLMFFKGALLEDPEGVLALQGPNSRSARRIELTSVEDVRRLSATIAVLVAAAIGVEESGLEVEPAAAPEPVPELRARLDAEPALAAAFDALTPGRRREYHLYFSGAKKSATRESRVEKCVPRILAGRGMRD